MADEISLDDYFGYDESDIKKTVFNFKSRVEADAAKEYDPKKGESFDQNKHIRFNPGFNIYAAYAKKRIDYNGFVKEVKEETTIKGISSLVSKTFNIKSLSKDKLENLKHTHKEDPLYYKWLAYGISAGMMLMGYHGVTEGLFPFVLPYEKIQEMSSFLRHGSLILEIGTLVGFGYVAGRLAHDHKIHNSINKKE
ncbi:MAG: hypothetical protein WC755_01560 [Candidatus Woesearchaeota archaeon]|jgi:hypothetical protein